MNASVFSVVSPRRRAIVVGGGSVAGLLLLTGPAALGGLWKILVVAWVAFFAMAMGTLVGAVTRTKTARGLVWGYGMASGAMVTSAAIFLLPQAFNLHPAVGGLGVAAGILLGYAGHTIGHRLAHFETPFDMAAAELTAHSLSAGAILGLIYATLPELGLLLGLAIVSHKGPAGYAAARRLDRSGRPVTILLLPAAGVGLTALPASLADPVISTEMKAAVFGFAAGVFLHLAMDFLPECETGGEIGEAAGFTDNAHELLDRLRGHAVVSTGLGGLVVFLGWVVIA